MSAREAEQFRKQSARLGAERGLVSVPKLGWHGTLNFETAKTSDGVDFVWPNPPAPMLHP